MVDMLENIFLLMMKFHTIIRAQNVFLSFDMSKASLHLDERWDRLFELTFRRATYGALSGALAAALLFSEMR